MEPTDQKHQDTCQDTERSPNLTIINRLPDEVLLEIFDYYRLDYSEPNLYWMRWWFRLALVCRKWHGVMFASPFRLDLKVVVRPEKPRQIEAALSSHLPIYIDYEKAYGREDMTDSVLWRLRAALGHRDRVRYISFSWSGDGFREFIRATNYHFPALEKLYLLFPDDHEPDIPATFLRGTDQSVLPLRHLGLYRGSLAYVSRLLLLLSPTSLTDLSLNVPTLNAAAFGSSRGLSLLDCLQRMPRLRSLNLTTPNHSRDFQSKYQHSAPKDTTVLMSQLTRFHFYGLTAFLNDLMSGFSAPFLQDVRFSLSDTKIPPLYISRFIDDGKEEFRSVGVTFDGNRFRLVSSTHSGREIDHFNPRPTFSFWVNYSPHSITSMNGTPLAKFAMAEELALNIASSDSEMRKWDHVFSLGKFLRQFRSVRVLRVNPFVRDVGICLQQDDGEATIFPVLEKVEVSIFRLARHSDEEYQRRAAEALAAFKSCRRAGRLVKVYHCEQTQAQYTNSRCL